MENEKSKFNDLLSKIGLSTEVLVNNRIVEFLVERYVNWSTESQKRFKKVMSIFLIVVSVSLVCIVYLTTLEKHKKIQSHQSMYQMLKKYVIKKGVIEDRLAQLQAGGGGIVAVNKAMISKVVEKHEVPKEGIDISLSNPQETPKFKTRDVTVSIPMLTYPQLVNVVFDLESLGTNMHITELKLSRGLELGFYAMQANFSVVEPVVEEVKK